MKPQVEPQQIEQNTAESGIKQDTPFAGIKKHRSYREAADAGLILWRQNFAVFLLFFGLPFWITAFSLRIVLPVNLQYLSWVFIWFLKPLFDRIVLHIISIRFFDKNASPKRLFQGFGKGLCRGLAGDLLWRRFSPLRSAVMPVRVLEKNLKTGKNTAQRRQILKKGGIDYCFLLTIWAIAVEITLLTGEIVFFATIAELFAPGLIASIDNLLDIEIFFYAAWCFNFMLVETIYVCMGFSLYINSRIEVEGWDIEIKFRDFAQKQRAAQKILSKGKNTALIVCLFACLLMPVKTFAEENPPLAQLQEILDSPEFGGEEDSWGIRFKNRRQEENLPEINTELIECLQTISAHILRFLLIGIMAGLLVFLIIYLQKNKWNLSGKQKNYEVKTVFDNRSEDPKYLLQRALSFHEQGDMRLSWGYCTAAAIKSWTFRGIVFPPNATESDCADIVRSTITEETHTQKFGSLIKNWIHLAYAGQFPPDGSFKEAVDFVRAQYG